MAKVGRKAVYNPNIGDIYGKWIVVGPEYKKGHQRFFSCQCQCGLIAERSVSSVVSGHSKGCRSCTKSSCVDERKIWYSMWDRCTNPASDSYARYGLRGITVCPEWRDFDVFLSDVGIRPTKRHTIDRINNNNGYTPGNVKWSDPYEQQNNKSNNRNVEYRGDIKTISQWARELGINRATLESRLEKWSIEKSFETPLIKSKSKYRHVL